MILPLRPPHYINFKSTLFLTSDSSSGSAGVFHISLRPQKRNTTERVGKRKNKRTIWVKHKKGSFVTPCIPCASVDYRRRVFFAKLLQATRNVNSSWLFPHSFLLLTVVDCLSVSPFANRPTLGSLANWPLSSLGPYSFPPPLPVSSEISSSGLCLFFAPKHTKR